MTRMSLLNSSVLYASYTLWSATGFWLYIRLGSLGGGHSGVRAAGVRASKLTAAAAATPGGGSPGADAISRAPRCHCPAHLRSH